MANYWSFNFFSKLMQVANCVWFCQNPFCCEVHEGCLFHDKNVSDKADHNLQLKDQSRTLQSPFFPILHDNRNAFSFNVIFSSSTYRAGSSVYAGSVYEISYL